MLPNAVVNSNSGLSLNFFIGGPSPLILKTPSEVNLSEFDEMPSAFDDVSEFLLNLLPTRNWFHSKLMQSFCPSLLIRLISSASLETQQKPDPNSDRRCRHRRRQDQVVVRRRRRRPTSKHCRCLSAHHRRRPEKRPERRTSASTSHQEPQRVLRGEANVTGPQWIYTNSLLQ